MYLAERESGRRPIALGLTILVHLLLLAFFLFSPPDPMRRSLRHGALPLVSVSDAPSPPPEPVRVEKTVRAASHPVDAQPAPGRPAARASILSVPAPVAITVPELPVRSIDLSFDRSRLGGASTLAPPVKPQVPAASDRNVALPVWVKQPTHKQMANADPPFASFMHVSGQVLLHCQIGLNQRAHDCLVIREEPEGYRFGDAAIQVSAHFRIRPVVIDGVATPDARVAIPVRFGN